MRDKTHSLYLPRFRWRVLLLCLVPLCSAAAADQDASVSHILLVAPSVGTSGSIPDPAYPSDTVYVPLLSGAKKALVGWTEYNINTCALISTGSYTSPTAPMFGKVSYAVMNGTIPSGPCTGTVLPFNFASYVWTAKTSAAPQDFFSLQWTTPDGRFTQNSDWLSELLPEKETTAPKGWADSISRPTWGKWQQTIQPPQIAYKGVTVQESNPGGGGPDTCWFAGSKLPPFTSITGGTWSVSTGNIWQFDFVGYGPGGVKYYRAKGRAPCGTTFPQQMKIKFATGDSTLYNYATVNTLGAKIGVKTVTSIRAGKTQTRVWP